MHYKNCSGFTLPEILITLGLIAILLSTAVPGISNMIKDNRLATQIKRVVADIHFARSEASKRDVRIEHVAANGDITVLKQSTPLLAGEVIDASRISAAKLHSSRR